MTLRFDGRVAVVTGAGRGLGRAHALLLAELGAAVVVNDVGGSMGGRGTDAGPAAEVVAEITAAGGRAVADTSDVSTGAGGEAVVAIALEQLGGLDVVVNNAGIMRWAGFPDLDEESLAAHLAVHVHGTFNTMTAAWPHFVERGYGRFVNTTSTGVLGLAQNPAYAAAKGAVIGLTRSAAVGGAEVGIKANLISPVAFTRMAGEPGGPMDTPAMAPELVAPMAAFLAHEDCPVTGEIYSAGAGRFARVFIAETEGVVHADGAPTIDDVAAAWAAINDESAFTIPADLPAWSASFLRHL